MVSLNNLATQCRKLTNRGSSQEILQAVRNSYAFVVKGIWFEQKKLDIGEINGNYIVTFKDQQPVLDTTINQYYIDISSTYLDLPQECGIISVGYMSSINTNFILTNVGTVGRLSRIKAGVMGGRQLYYTDNTKMYFPRMTQTTALPIISRFALALDNYDVDSPLNIAPNIQAMIVQTVVAQFNPQIPAPINEKIK